jgi:hypothetical protein
MSINLSALKFETEVDHFDDVVRIYTKMGIHYPKVSLGSKCTIADLPCDDTHNPESAAYQIANLFKAAPAMLEALKVAVEYLEDREDFAVEDAEEDNENIYTDLKAAIAKAEGKQQ